MTRAARPICAADRWGEIGRRLALENVEWINGLEILDNMSYISADEVHPNIYGVQRIADRLTERIRRRIGG